MSLRQESCPPRRRASPPPRARARARVRSVTRETKAENVSYQSNRTKVQSQIIPYRIFCPLFPLKTIARAPLRKKPRSGRAVPRGARLLLPGPSRNRSSMYTSSTMVKRSNRDQEFRVFPSFANFSSPIFSPSVSCSSQRPTGTDRGAGERGLTFERARVVRAEAPRDIIRTVNSGLAPGAGKLCLRGNWPKSRIQLRPPPRPPPRPPV